MQPFTFCTNVCLSALGQPAARRRRARPPQRIVVVIISMAGGIEMTLIHSTRMNQRTRRNLIFFEKFYELYVL